MRYFTSDLHLFHNLVHKKYRSNYSTLEDMHNDIIAKWNRTVKKNDVVFVLGDVSFGKFEETKQIISKLNGKKLLIRGNHDERFTSKQFIEMGFEDVRDIFVYKKNDEKFILSHFPFSSSIKFFFYKLKDKILFKKNPSNYYKLYLSYKGCKLIHGHHHDGPPYLFDSVNVAWDVNKRLLDENEIHQRFVDNEPSKLKRFLLTIKSLFW